MKFYFDQTPTTGRKNVVGPFDTQNAADALCTSMTQNMIAARAHDPEAPLYTFSAVYQEADDWVQKQPKCYARIAKLYEGVEREFMVYSDGTEDLVPLEG